MFANNSEAMMAGIILFVVVVGTAFALYPNVKQALEVRRRKRRR